MLTIQNLSVERGQHLLFSDINCRLNAGEFLQIRGANGSGKSTLLRTIAGYLLPESGMILWQGKSITTQHDTYPQQLHYLGHQHGVKAHLSVYENLLLNCALANIHLNHKQLTNILQQIGLLPLQHKLAMHLSAGQSRRLALARLLLAPQPLWILDEPTTALDAQAQDLLITLLKQHLSNNGMAIIATHQELTLTGKLITLGEQNA